MEGRVILKDINTIAVRVIDGSYSIFRLKSGDDVEIGDIFLGPLTSPGLHLLLHSTTDTIVEAKVSIPGAREKNAKGKAHLGSFKHS